MSDLKSCPFCGGKAEIRYTGDGAGPYGYISNILMKKQTRICHVQEVLLSNRSLHQSRTCYGKME